MGQRCVRLPKRIVILIYRMRIKLSLLQWRLLPAGCQKEKRDLQSQLDTLTAEEGWELAVFSLLELGEVDTATLSSLKRFMQQAIDNDEMPLSQWFRRVADWPDRCERVRILLRAIAFELSICIEPSEQSRLAAALVRLRRLLLFLGLEKSASVRSGFASCRLIHYCRYYSILFVSAGFSVIGCLIDLPL